jgi:hypothetical protein
MRSQVGKFDKKTRHSAGSHKYALILRLPPAIQFGAALL